MRAKLRQYEMDLGREPFVLVAEVAQNHALIQADAVKRESDHAKAARTQWWFDQMHAAVQHAKGFHEK